MFIATNRITIPTEQHERMIAAFERSAPMLKQFSGFQSMEIWVSEDKQHLLAVSHWATRDSYEAYIHSETFRQHHGGSSSQEMRPHANITYYSGQKLS
jgi:heme-degrading monooxygenase HmoA